MSRPVLALVARLGPFIVASGLALGWAEATRAQSVLTCDSSTCDSTGNTYTVTVTNNSASTHCYVFEAVDTTSSCTSYSVGTCGPIPSHCCTGNQTCQFGPFPWNPCNPNSGDDYYVNVIQCGGGGIECIGPQDQCS